MYKLRFLSSKSAASFTMESDRQRVSGDGVQGEVVNDGVGEAVRLILKKATTKANNGFLFKE